MNLEDQAKTKAKELKGQSKQGLGRVPDDQELQAVGQADQAKAT